MGVGEQLLETQVLVLGHGAIGLRAVQLGDEFAMCRAQLGAPVGFPGVDLGGCGRDELLGSGGGKQPLSGQLCEGTCRGEGIVGEPLLEGILPAPVDRGEKLVERRTLVRGLAHLQQLRVQREFQVDRTAGTHDPGVAGQQSEQVIHRGACRPGRRGRYGVRPPGQSLQLVQYRLSAVQQ